MKKFLHFFIVGSFISVESLTLNLSNLDEEIGNDSFVLKDIPEENHSIPEVENRNLENSNDFQQLAEPNESFETFQNINSLRDRVHSVQGFDIFYQDGESEFTHVKSRYDKPSAEFHLIQEKTETANEGVKNNQTEENDAEELDAMLVDLQHQTNRMRKYLERLCGKRHSISKKLANDENLSASFAAPNNPKKISMP